MKIKVVEKHLLNINNLYYNILYQYYANNIGDVDKLGKVNDYALHVILLRFEDKSR